MLRNARTLGEALVSGAVIVTCTMVLAQHADDAEALDCTRWMSKNLSQTEMNTCAERDAHQNKERLKALVEELRRKLGPHEPEQWSGLETNQKAWEAFVEQDCRWESAFFERGSAQPMVHANCIADATARRIDRLSIFLCEGGGMTGPCPESKRYTHPAGFRSRAADPATKRATPRARALHH